MLHKVSPLLSRNGFNLGWVFFSLMGAACAKAHNPFLEIPFDEQLNALIYKTSQLPEATRMVRLSPHLPATCVLEPYTQLDDGSIASISFKSTLDFTLFGPIVKNEDDESSRFGIVIPMAAVKSQLANVFVLETTVMGRINLRDLSEAFVFAPTKIDLPLCYYSANITVVRHDGSQKDMLEAMRRLFIQKTWPRIISCKNVAENQIPAVIVDANGEALDASDPRMYENLLLKETHLSYGPAVRSWRPRVHQLSHALTVLAEPIYDLVKYVGEFGHGPPLTSYYFDFDMGYFSLFHWVIQAFETQIEKYYPEQRHYLLDRVVGPARAILWILGLLLLSSYDNRKDLFYEFLKVELSRGDPSTLYDYSGISRLYNRAKRMIAIDRFWKLANAMKDDFLHRSAEFTIAMVVYLALPGTIVAEDIEKIELLPRIWKSYLLNFHHNVVAFYHKAGSKFVDFRPMDQWNVKSQEKSIISVKSLMNFVPSPLCSLSPAIAKDLFLNLPLGCNQKRPTL